jgi:hypothetical protein
MQDLDKNSLFVLELLGDYSQKIHCSMSDQDLLYVINMLSSGQMFMDLVDHLQRNRRRQYLRLFPLIQQASKQIVNGVGNLDTEEEELVEELDEDLEDEEPLVGVIANE